MAKRFKLIGWYILLIPVMFITILLTIFLCPIWVIIWAIWDWWFPKEVLNWIETTFPVDVIS